MPNNKLVSCYPIQETYPILEDSFCVDNPQDLLNNDIPCLIINTCHKNMEKNDLNKNAKLLNLDDNEYNYFSCEEDDDGDEFLDFELSQTLDNHHNDQASTISHIPFSEHLSNNFVKQSLIQRILNWFRTLIQYLRNTWFSNKSNNDLPIADISSTVIDSPTKEVNTYENVVVATTSNLNNKPTFAPHSSHPNAFYQEAKKEDYPPLETSRYGLN